MTPAQLVRIRQRLGLTQEQLAEALGVSQAAVSRWESGLRAVPHWLQWRIRDLPAK